MPQTLGRERYSGATDRQVDELVLQPELAARKRSSGIGLIGVTDTQAPTRFHGQLDQVESVAVIVSPGVASLHEHQIVAGSSPGLRNTMRPSMVPLRMSGLQ